jgi:hypothetical protein
MRSSWEHEAASYQQRRRDAGVTPWTAARRWRRLCLISLAVNIALVILLVATRAR